MGRPVNVLKVSTLNVICERPPKVTPFRHTGMALIHGLPTVIGGVSSREFLQSIEVLDNSVDEAAPLGMDWRISAHALMHPVSRNVMQHVHISRYVN